MRFAPALRVSLPGALVFLALALPLVAADEKIEKSEKSSEKTTDKQPPAEKTERLVQLGTILGTLDAVNETDGEIAVRYVVRLLEPNVAAQADYLRQAQQLAQRQQAIMRNRNPAQRQQQFAQLYRDAMALQAKEANLFKIKEVQQKIVLRLEDDSKIRTAMPPEVFDDKGNIKRYTAKELKELKGASKLPGYQAERDSLEKGRAVLVQVGVKIKLRPKGKGKGKGKDKEKEAESAPDKKMPPDSKKPLALLILVGTEAKK